MRTNSGSLRAVREDALDDEILLEALDRLRASQEDLGHAARRQAGDELVLAEWTRVGMDMV